MTKGGERVVGGGSRASGNLPSDPVGLTLRPGRTDARVHTRTSVRGSGVSAGPGSVYHSLNGTVDRKNQVSFNPSLRGP